MILKTIVVIGSRKYRNIGMMREILLMYILDIYYKDVVVMSGKCPMEDSVDNWAIEWAKKHGCLPVEVPPRIEGSVYFFERNKQLAYYADEIIAFIPRNQYRSGAWNCISEFRKMGKTNYRVFDESGREWDREWKI